MKVATFTLLLLFFLVLESHVITSLLFNEFKEWNKRVAFREGCTRVFPVTKGVRKLIVVMPFIFACALQISSQQTAATNSLVCFYFSDLDGSAADDIVG